MSKTAQDIIAILVDDLRTRGDVRPDRLTIDQLNWLVAGIEDGAALVTLGITDDDQEAVEEAHELLKDQRRAVLLNSAPGYAAQVWGGWVWIAGSNEMRWSKRTTRAACERAVEQAIDRVGIDRAFFPQ